MHPLNRVLQRAGLALLLGMALMASVKFFEPQIDAAFNNLTVQVSD